MCSLFRVSFTHSLYSFEEESKGTDDQSLKKEEVKTEEVKTEEVKTEEVKTEEVKKEEVKKEEVKKEEEKSKEVDDKAEKRPKEFKIDLLECVFCGYCVEACPCDAIRMDTGIFSFTGKTRDEFVLNKEQLMANERSKDFSDD